MKEKDWRMAKRNDWEALSPMKPSQEQLKSTKASVCMHRFKSTTTIHLTTKSQYLPPQT